ncbi:MULTISPECIES: tRNA 2-selenouridine(34) synthase MnmH [unclassified Burkholderia]|uniref:tRNA 2-selenouridine(34) synthase MnmH n=1 Tax=unclassified Burkholderia TaxID=2613784 RepID=UPI000F5761C7|nr:MULTISPECIES: tRNA 2-selenouridine(34) synthase MnmH [unclassified Burkholderia]MCR4467997.1 tRNA 2-selenouridine(34) synthase MnmH [Burkholderia sp. SCN-KJ]RQR87608.1 tRNA 2-selenouridine(34) synthase MnmH [Burkholderia sp. Bp9011]RQR96956.1 tRNA 2-selenouridine(34) synthase MnmH [Burkholderia sp. Bp9010]RQS07369.1 tRNA 2-selenouridine(34) synthase MnmH [Burkholderia sp. Bp8991]RQS26768.1 tRNA 2-selenouridine(34) synthase MnmH [Burkholderia sp. Bp8995]
MKNLIVTLDRAGEFDEIIDVRTPLEFAEDHIPGALNAPVLSNEERVIVGTMYRQVSPYEATRVGAAMVARNIARHLDTTFADRPRNWRPLIYCWRGGKRSGSMTTWFNLIGWQARQLDGGYKAYRHSVCATLDTLPTRFRYIALVGHTGCGKTRLLNALRDEGAQTLDLEALARHRGSLLGALPGKPQPSQKGFDSGLVETLGRFDPEWPVFVESESRRIGLVHLPIALIDAFHAGPWVQVEAAHDERIAFLLDDYAHLFDEPAAFKAQLNRLIGLHSRDEVAHWHALIDADARAELFTELIDKHYDPAYARTYRATYNKPNRALTFTFRPNAADGREQARALLDALAQAGLPASPAAGGAARAATDHNPTTTAR